ncbi:MAG: [protein-PII] uridylyltransferase [Aliidongia sp.]
MPEAPSGTASVAAIPEPERILDIATLDAALVAATAEPADKARQRIVATVKPALAAGQAEIERRFMASQDGAQVMAADAWLMDSVIASLYGVIRNRLFRAANPTAGEHLAICAVGGYGRGELAPHSDIDLLFLLPYKLTPHTEQVVEFLLYVLWDCGLKVGHATRSIDESLRQAMADITIRTALLESRLITGDHRLFLELERRFAEEIIEGSAIAFVDAKLAERDARHQRMGDSRYVLEPNIKEGKGGLRDLHGLLWIAKYLFRVNSIEALVERGVLSADEARRFERDQIFLWTVRCHLHYLAGRPEERLTFDVQTEIGRRMGYTDHAGARGVERFMKHYFLIAKDVGDLTRIFIAALEAEQKRKPTSLWRRLLPSASNRTIEGFKIDGGRLTVASEHAFADDPVNLIRLFHVAQTNRLDIHPAALRLVTQSLKLIDGKLRANREANRLFLEILTSRIDPETSLRRLNEAGVFGRFIPDFGRVVAQMQYDMYHVYTVDEHTIFAIGNIAKMESGELKDELPLISSMVESISSRAALYVAVLLHDIAKGRPTDHSEMGAKIALKLGPRLGLTDEETETVAWLVLHHLDMSRTAFKRDIDDAKTVQDFVATVQSPERLKLLLCLTAADIRAVGPKVWNGWKGGLLRELYSRAQELMSGNVVGRCPRRAHRQGAEPGARAAAGIQRRGFRRLHPARLSVLLAQPRPGRPGASCAPHPPGRPQWRFPDRDQPDRRLSLGHRGHRLYRRPSRPVLAHCRRLVAGRRQDRRCPHRHHDQRHGARHLLDPGSGRRRLRARRQAGQARRAAGKRAERQDRPQCGTEARAGLSEPYARLHRGAARADRQQGERRPHRDRSQRPRPPGPAVRFDPRADLARRPDRRRQDRDLWRGKWSTCSSSRTCSASRSTMRAS